MKRETGREFAVMETRTGRSRTMRGVRGLGVLALLLCGIPSSECLASTGNGTAAKSALESVSVTVQSSPAGLSFTVDGTSYASTQVFNWVPGSSHMISTTSPQGNGAGTRYIWSDWSDSGSMSHVIVPSSSGTYTADFTTQHLLTMTKGPGGSSVGPASGYYDSGKVVGISATAVKGYTFSSWTGTGSGSYSGNANPASVTMNAPIAETASFFLSSPMTGGIVIDNYRSATNSRSVTLGLTWGGGGGTGVVRMRFSDDGAHWSAWQSLLPTLAYTLPEGADGHRTVRVQYLDQMNNHSDIFSDYILLDTTTPTGTVLINDGATTTKTQAVTLKLTWADTGAGASRMRFSDDGAHWTVWETLMAVRAHTLPPGLGYHTVRVQYLDGASNYSAVYSDYIKLVAP